MLGVVKHSRLYVYLQCDVMKDKQSKYGWAKLMISGFAWQTIWG